MKWLPRVLFGLTLLFVGCNHVPAPKPFDMTLERKATHMVVTYDGLKGEGECTATAIGPHALLTATHCNEKDNLTDIKLDIARQTFHIQRTLHDGRDHDIYLIDGPPLRDFVDYKVRQAKLWENVHLYGNGGGEFPSRRLDGVRLPFDDPSEVDNAAGVQQFSMPVIHGDSGSAVFASDGSIVAVTTYLWKTDEKEEEGKDTTTVDFTPGFTEEQIADAVSFAPNPDWTPEKKAVVAPLPRPRSPFDFFFFNQE